MSEASNHPLDDAAHHCGGITKLAARLGLGQSVVSNWKARGTLIDPLSCTAIEEIPGCPVKRWDLRPDDWYRIWPELIGKEGAPAVPMKAAALMQVRLLSTLSDAERGGRARPLKNEGTAHA